MQQGLTSDDPSPECPNSPDEDDVVKRKDELVLENGDYLSSREPSLREPMDYLSSREPSLREPEDDVSSEIIRVEENDAAEQRPARRLGTFRRVVTTIQVGVFNMIKLAQ